ncbi:AGC AKT protein kinase [Aspergillus sp. HF37]|nr:AGC AKT protein kinase [Aspergillus sp. HF37]
MSWKLTKKLKETHLAPLTQTFTRSSSTSTIKGGDSSEESQTPVVPQPPTTPSTDSEQIIASESLVSPPVAPVKPGILIVTLHEGKGFSLSPHYEHVFNSHFQHNNSYAPSIRPSSSSSHSTHAQTTPFVHHGRPQSTSEYLPYALLDFEKNQVFVDAVSGSPENPLWAGDNTAFKFDVSRKTELTLQLYLRNPAARPGAGRSEDIFLGAVKVHPRFDDPQPYIDDPKLSKKDNQKAAAAHAGQERHMGQMGAEWSDLQFGTGSLKIDFDLLKVVGKGSFGKVMQVMKKDTGRIYALKTIRKAHIINRSEVTHTLAERSVLAQINNPFIVPLKFSFQSPEKLYLVLAFVNGGELFHHLQREQRFDINRARFYTAELLCALECLHGFKVIYRDLKPENILLDYSGHIALCDFGLCKLDMKDEDRTNTFCGTPEYLAPELLFGRGYTKTVDWWTLGVLLYEMLTGLPPFYDENTNEMYRKILEEPLRFPGSEIVPPAARDLLSRLLDRDPQRRLGANGAAEIKSHHFFTNIDWRKLLQRKYEPSFRPNVLDARDTANFDHEFTREAPQDSYVDGPMLSQTMQKQFEGWSYNRPVAGLGDAGGSVKDPAFGSIPE